ncbi:MAG: hypothetical protein HKN07_04130 [Acidimicrobiia bacterium]|nr:hypothetical protein [Acidimicrobiia bacterium]
MPRILIAILVLALTAGACASDSGPATEGPLTIERIFRDDVPWPETPELQLSNVPCPAGLDVDTIKPLESAEITLELVAPLEGATTMAFASSDLAFMGTREGRIYQWVEGGAPEFVMDLSGETTTERDQGLLGLLVREDSLFVYRTDTKDDSVLEEYPLSAGIPVRSDRFELLRADQPSKEHNGGDIVFGPDGNLYLTIGDGGGQGGAYITNRVVATAFGGLLRLNYERDDVPTLTAAPDNPYFGDDPGSDLTWVWGLRHPYRFSFDSATDDLWIADVGQQCVEEVTVLPGGGLGGEHLGWNAVEGTREFMGPLDLDLTPPTFTYLHSNGYCAVIGGHVYRGSAMPELVGQYIFGDYCKQAILAYDPATDEIRELQRGSVTPVAFVVEPDGELIVVDFVAGAWRLRQS